MDPEKKSLNFIFPTKYVIPESSSRLAIGQVSNIPPLLQPSKLLRMISHSHHGDGFHGQLRAQTLPRPAQSSNFAFPGFRLPRVVICLEGFSGIPLHPRSSPPAKGGWKTILSYWGPVTFQGQAVKLRGGK